MTPSAASAEGGPAVLVRGIALWIALLGLSYLASGLVMINLLHHPPAGTDTPWFQLPWGMSERELLKGALLIAAAAMVSSVQLFRLKKSGQILGTLFLLAAGGWALWNNYLYEAQVMPLITAGINLWLASLLWRADAGALFSSRMRTAP